MVTTAKVCVQNNIATMAPENTEYRINMVDSLLGLA
jgi:hypothetical protein